ncbi:CASP-like protein 2C1 [Asparagus officinalis]|uniref:CASP-like protein 2C1 n=1 Tax=Asparagus officinalis TaxID=4686 RepID=UPI00098E8511|nr:CASP-like protein 2C1 [Asparagus officinalis]
MAFSSRSSWNRGFLLLLLAVKFSSAAVIIRFDAETKKVMFIERTVYVKELPALWVLITVASVAAGYHFLQLCRCLALAWIGQNLCKCNKIFSWVCLLFDQGMSYATFAATLAAGQGALIALTGVKQLQWEKLCHFYPRFCVQGAVGVALGGVSSLVMIPVALISAYRVFRLYPSPNRN